MSKYYTINILNDDNDLLSRILELTKKGIYISTHTCMFRKELSSLGIFVKNEKHVPYSIKWDDDKKTEDYILKYLRDNYQIELQEIVAILDYDLILENIIMNQKIIGYKSLTEAVIGIEANTHNLFNKIKSYLNDIDCKRNTLLITDPYLFQVTGNTQHMLINLIKESHASRIKVYTDKDGNAEKIRKNIIALGINLDIIKTDKIHDRFWICPESKKGFVVGTSLNGLGKRLALIDYLCQEDIDEILSFVSKIPA